MEELRRHFSAVLGDEIYQRIETVQMFSAEVVDKKYTSSLVKTLNVLCPLSISELGHLKRVKANPGHLAILLLPCKRNADPGQQETELQASLIQGHDLVGLGEVSVVSVSKQKPITRKQYEEASSLWPTHFHEDKRLEKILKGEIFSATELSEIETYMSIALQEAKSHGEASVGAAIVDPVMKRVVAQGCTVADHPTRHAVMVCIDEVARGQGGGAWCDDVRNIQKQPIAPEVEDDAGGERGPPAKRHKQSTQYLCTGYDAYITMEPCVMCSMALLHSRIRRVFYCHRNPFCGALGSQYKLHIQQGFNHHFEVYEGSRTSSK